MTASATIFSPSPIAWNTSGVQSQGPCSSPRRRASATNARCVRRTVRVWGGFSEAAVAVVIGYSGGGVRGEEGGDASELLGGAVGELLQRECSGVRLGGLLQRGHLPRAGLGGEDVVEMGTAQLDGADTPAVHVHGDVVLEPVHGG